MNKIKFNEVTTDILLAINNLNYNDEEKNIISYNLMQTFWRFTEDLDIYEYNLSILNENALNGSKKMLEKMFKGGKDGKC